MLTAPMPSISGSSWVTSLRLAPVSDTACSIAKSAVGVGTKVLGYVLYPLKKGAGAIRK